MDGNQGEATKGRGALQVGENDDNHMLSTCTKNCKKRKMPSAGLELVTLVSQGQRSTSYAIQDNGCQNAPPARPINQWKFRRARRRRCTPQARGRLGEARGLPCGHPQLRMPPGSPALPAHSCAHARAHAFNPPLPLQPPGPLGMHTPCRTIRTHQGLCKTQLQ